MFPRTDDTTLGRHDGYLPDPKYPSQSSWGLDLDFINFYEYVDPTKSTRSAVSVHRYRVIDNLTRRLPSDTMTSEVRNYAIL